MSNKHDCDQIKYTPEQLQDIYKNYESRLNGVVTKEVFELALITSASYFRHQSGNIESSRNLYRTLQESTKKDLEKAQLEIKQLKEELAIKNAMLDALAA